MSDKDKIISEIYYDQAGFGSIATTYKDAKKKDASITMQDVKEWFQENVERKKQLSGYNSFIAPDINFEYQLDLFFISKNDLDNQKYRIGLLLIDVFSRKAVVVPIASKQPADITAGIMEALNKMGGKPKLIYSDDEGSLNTQDLVDFFKDEGIQNYKTRGHPHFAERFIRTFKDMLFKRVDADEKKGKVNIQWVDYILEIMLTYNSKMVHSAHDMTPNDAHKKGNHLEVKMKLEMNRIKTRKYPPVRVGDEVKIYRKKGISEKERTSNWSSVKYKVSRVEKKLGQDYYSVEGMNRPYLRSEILKV